jgi:glycine cleavage system H protein
MSEKYTVLPCNGLDKGEGPLAREVALAIVAASGGEVICPVVLHRTPVRYTTKLNDSPLLVIDGCATRCASRLAAEHELKIQKRVQISEAAAEASHSIENTLIPGLPALEFCRKLAQELVNTGTVAETLIQEEASFSAPVEYESFMHDKFIFRVPKTGYLFNENDCWARVSGNRARVGVSDYMQQYLADILFCETPEVGAYIEQFGEIGTAESVKAVFELISPVTGKVVAVNGVLANKPELINQDPYEQGWIAEIELSDLASDRELLINCEEYLAVTKRKATESHKT